MTAVPGQAMSGTRNYMEELRQRVDKVYDLRDEEEQHGFAEMAEDPNHSECHPSKVTERVPYEHRRWVPNGKQKHNNVECRSKE